MVDLFFNCQLNNERPIKVSPSNKQQFNVSATKEQWNKVGVQYGGTKATVTRRTLLSVQLEVQKLIDRVKADCDKEIQRLTEKKCAILPCQHFTIKDKNGVAI